MNSSFESLIEQYPLPVARQLCHQVVRYASRIAVVDARGSLAYSVPDVQIDELAADLSPLGLRSEEYVTMQFPNDNVFATLPFALLRLGVIPVLVIPSQRALDIDALIKLAQPAAHVIHGENHAELVRQMAYKHACLRHVLVTGETVSNDSTPLFSPHGEQQAWLQPDVSAITLLLFSGDTTGTPKLIPRRHVDYSYNFSASAELCSISQRNVYLTVLPVAYNLPLACPSVLGTLACSRKVVLTGNASCDEAMSLITQERVAHAALVPMLAQLWAQVRVWEDSDLSSLHIIQAGGTRPDPTLAEQVIATFDYTPQRAFGMTEGLFCFTRLDDSHATILHGQRRPLSPLDETRIADQGENDVVPGETGQLLTRSPHTILGYCRTPTHSAQAFTVQGFYRTSDNVRLDEVGNLHVEGRIKEQINCAGERIVVAEVESALLRLAEM